MRDDDEYAVWQGMADLARQLSQARGAGIHIAGDDRPAAIAGETAPYEGMVARLDDLALAAGQQVIAMSFACERAEAVLWIERPGRADADLQPELAKLRDFASALLEFASAHRDLRLLMHEIEHRCVNDLQLMISTLGHQMRQSRNNHVRRALAEAQGRVEVLAASRSEYRRGDRMLSLEALVQSTCRAVAINAAPRGISVHVEPLADEWPKVRPVIIPRIALALNELLTNAVKHAFLGRRHGVVHVSLRRGPAMFEIAVEDDGVPIAELTLHEGRGLDLVSRLIASVGGELILPQSGKVFKLCLNAGRL